MLLTLCRESLTIRAMPSEFDSKTYYVYIMASRSLTLYIGFTSDIETRVKQHKNHTYQGFSADYRCERLVHLERFGEPVVAIGRKSS